MASVEIKKHIRHTNNTLILGELNGNVQQGVPSLASAIIGADNWGTVIEEIYGEDDNRRLVVETIDDVTRIFKPTYYFSVGEESYEGVNRMIVRHGMKHDESALPVEITRETLCYKILDMRGRVHLAEILDDLRKNLAKARDHYLVATKTNNPKLLREQENLRRNFVSRLTEPVITYLMAAESCRNYVKNKEGTPAETAPGRKVKKIEIFKPDMKTMKLKRATLEVPVKKKDIFEQPQPDWDVVAGKALEAPIRQGQRLLGASVEGYFKGADSEELLPEVKKKLLMALTETGVGSELMIDHIKPDQAGHKLLASSSAKLLAENPDLKLLTTGAAAAEAETDGEAEPEAGAESTAEAADAAPEAADSDEKTQALIRKKQVEEAVTTKKQADKLRGELSSEELLDHVEVIQNAALQYYQGDKDKQKLVKIYTHTLTPVGRIENKMEGIRQSLGEQELRREHGFELFLDICLEEACQASPLAKEFREWIRKALLKEPYEIDEADENDWIDFHDQIMNAAQQTFIDYMDKVSPIIAQLMGISTFLKTAQQARHRVPRVLVANVSEEDLLLDPDYLEKFGEFINALNDVNQEEFERAISIVIAPSLAQYYADDLFKTAFKEGMSVFFSPEQVVPFNMLNDNQEVRTLVEDWSATEFEQLHYQSGVLCVPDSVLLPKGYQFKLGEFLASKKTCAYTTDEAVAVRGCFNAAGIVARNDDTKFVEGALKQQREKLRLEKEWPSLALRFEDRKVEPLYVTDYLSEGVILKSNITESLPFCLFEHSTDKNGKLKNQRVRFLNTLFVLGNRPVPLYEYRAAKYLIRALRLNYPNGAPANQLKFFASDSYAGIYKDGIDNSILNKDRYKMSFDPETSYFGIVNVAQDQEISGFEFGIEEGTT